MKVASFIATMVNDNKKHKNAIAVILCQNLFLPVNLATAKYALADPKMNTAKMNIEKKGGTEVDTAFNKGIMPCPPKSVIVHNCPPHDTGIVLGILCTRPYEFK